MIGIAFLASVSSHMYTHGGERKLQETYVRRLRLQDRG